MNKPKPIKWYGKKIGVIDNRVFKKRVRGSVHFVHHPDLMIAIQALPFDNLIKNKIDSIEVYNIESEDTFRISVEDFIAKKTDIDRGFGRQYAVVYEEWEKVGKEGG